MPSQPEVFGRRGTFKRRPWAMAEGRPDIRLRGRAGVKLREQVRREEPLCRICKANGQTSATVQVDHIVPLSDARWARAPKGAADVRSNLQGLCLDCHDAKTAEEARGSADLA